jgi:hypothetical protein
MFGDCPGDDRHRGWSGRGIDLLQCLNMREVQAAGHKRRSQQDGRDNDFLFHDRSLSQIKELLHGMGLPDAGETVGMTGTGELGTTMGGTLGAGTGTAGLTPRLPIW